MFNAAKIKADLICAEAFLILCSIGKRRSLPEIVNGKKSLFVILTLAPISSKCIVTLDIDLLLSELSPTKVQLIGFEETAPTIRRAVVPLLPQSSCLFGSMKPLVPFPLTIQLSLNLIIFTPNSFNIVNVLITSSDSNKFVIFVLPQDIADIISALCEIDLSPEIFNEPFNFNTFILSIYIVSLRLYIIYFRVVSKFYTINIKGFIMPKVEWGKKVVCLNCETKFYDLNRKPAVCPNCGTEYIDPSLDNNITNAKQVFTDNVDIVTDDNLVGSDASESIAEVEDIEIEDAIDDDTISLEDTENDDQVISEEVDDLDISDSNPENIEE